MTSSILEPLAPESEKDEGAQQRRRRGTLAGRIVSTLLFIVAVVLLWPAQFGGVTGLTVVNGHSMEPTYHTGDLVLSIRQPGYSAGDIVSYSVPAGQPGAGGRVIHRVFSLDASSGATTYTTKGDNNPSVDPWHFGTSEVLGKAIFMVPGIGAVFGGSTSSLMIGLLAGVAVTVVIWTAGSRRKRRHRARRT